MSLGKKERRFTIAIGLIIGVTASSMLVKHALEVKDEQAAQKPGNYNSQRTAVGNIPFQALPKPVILAIPNGVEVLLEGQALRIKGAKGELTAQVHNLVCIGANEGFLSFKANEES